MSHLTSSLLKGKATDAKLFSRNPNQRPHYHILVEADNQQFDIAVNIASEDPNTADVRVLYAIKSNITPPQSDKLLTLPNGMFNLPTAGIVGIDYVSDGLVTREQMKPLPLFNRSLPIAVLTLITLITTSKLMSLCNIVVISDNLLSLFVRLTNFAQ